MFTTSSSSAVPHSSCKRCFTTMFDGDIVVWHRYGRHRPAAAGLQHKCQHFLIAYCGRLNKGHRELLDLCPIVSVLCGFVGALRTRRETFSCERLWCTTKGGKVVRY